MRTVYKYTLTIADHKQVFEMPYSAELVSIQRQNDAIVMWWFVNTNNKQERRAFQVRGTGHEVTCENAAPLGTVQFAEHGLAWHVFEVDDEGRVTK